ncbi:MAG: CCA tRNA nucleotidyltransferase [Verrucomicrobiota bacterium]
MESIAIQIVRRLHNAGFEALFAGGCVRDRALGKTPKDIDIATSAHPEQILEVFGKGEKVGAHFGVILLREQGHHFEIATFRRDGEYEDGRHPSSVVFTDAREDAMRRDFTVNGMFYDPIEDRLIDYVDGSSDLKAGVIRAIGDPFDRFREDHLRILRAIRLATSLEFKIEEETWNAVFGAAQSVASLPAERIREELDKIWLHRNRVVGFDLLVESGLMELLLPEIMELRGCEQPPQWHPEGDVFTHTRLMLSFLPDDASIPLVLSTLFHDIGKPATFTYDEADDRIRFNGHDKLGAEMARSILNRLKYSNQVIEATTEAVSVHMKFKDVKKMRTATLKRFLARENFRDELELHRVDCLGSNGRLDNYDFVREKAAEFAAKPLIPPPFLTGKDLIDRELKPGPDFKEILFEAQDLQLEGNLTTRDDALQWLEEKITRLSEDC